LPLSLEPATPATHHGQPSLKPVEPVDAKWGFLSCSPRILEKTPVEWFQEVRPREYNFFGCLKRYLREYRYVHRIKSSKP